MWNQRFRCFTGEKTEKQLWKDAKIDKWVEYIEPLKSYVKCLCKLDIPSQNAIISRIIYKHNNQMRRDKPFQFFKRVDQLVCKYRELEILEDLNIFYDILHTIKSNRFSLVKDVGIPKKGFTSFIIENLYGSYHLGIKIIEACQQAYIYLDSHMRHGFFVSFNLFAIASVSRIWSIFTELLHITKLVFAIFKDILHMCYDVSISVSPGLKKILEDGLCNSTLERSKCLERKPKMQSGEDDKPEALLTGDIKFEDLGESVPRSFLTVSPSLENGILQSLKEEAKIPHISIAFNGLDDYYELKEGLFEADKNLYKRHMQRIKRNNGNKIDRKEKRAVKLGTLRTLRYKRLVPYPCTSLSRAYTLPFTGGEYKNVSPRTLDEIRECFRVVLKLTRKLKKIKHVRFALRHSSCKQETIYLILRLRKLLKKSRISYPH